MGAAAAFEAAKARVLAEVEPGVLDNGMRGSVQKYALVDPDDPSVHQCSACDGARCPPRCPWRGRLKPPQDARALPAEWRGRLAMGEPTLLM